MATAAVRLSKSHLKLDRTGVQTRPSLMILFFILADILSLSIAVGVSLIIRCLLQGHFELSAYLRLWPFSGVFLVVYAAVGLYPGLAITPPEELRRAVISSTLVFFILQAEIMTLRGATHIVTPALIGAVLVSVTLVPLTRATLRIALANRPWWGFPAVVIGACPVGRSVVKTLKRNPGLGFKVVAVVDEDCGDLEIEGVPVCTPEMLTRHIQPLGTHVYAIVAQQSTATAASLREFEGRGFHFSRLLYITDFVDSLCLWVTPRAMAGMLGLEVRPGFLMQKMQVVKRVLDLLFTVVLGLFFLPFLAAICAAIKFDSKGPVLFGHGRIGRNGRTFEAWKFRTMVTNGDKVLHEYLASNEAARVEWARDQKLRDDPRVTRVGRILRRVSLDEVPQLWNVLAGDMSLVGPRPIVHAEVERYGAQFDLYTKVSGGLTGLWQVSGRSGTSYAERVQLDTFYIRNWSVWLDFCILFRTIETVLLGKGAY